MKMKWCGILTALVLMAPGAAIAQHVRPHAEASADAATPEARRADIAFFREHFLAVDRTYSEAARAEAETRLAALEAQAGAVSQAYFELELARIVALADNGHTAYFPGPRSRRFNRITDVRFAPFGEDFYVLRASPASADLLGARLVAIDGHSAAEVRDVARTLGGGTAAWRDRNAAYFLESPEQMQALGANASAGATRYRFALLNGQEVERTLTPEPATDHRVRANSERWFYPAPAEGEGDAWRTAITVAQAPWSLQDPDDPFRWRRAPEIDGIVIELRQNNNGEEQSIADALREFVAAIEAEHPRNLVLDMRMNGGGDLNTTRAFMRSLPERVPGRIFALTSPWTFSAAISSIGYLEQTAPDRVTIIGEGVGDRLNFFSEGDVVTLPNSGAMILNATERHDYQTGCRGYQDCHGPVVRNPISVPALAPDIAAPWTIEAYLAGRDPGMEAVAAALRQ